ncbi:MAG TPA: 6,7-dimethyl-8-ribityllumazine synthase [Caldimonas sp.]|nr:6,7-dimethyl-8-ribityllumazine synthase [Caldimonas sp.]
MQHADQGRATLPDGRRLRIALVQARFNAAITDRLAAACREELERLGVPPDAIALVTVPGALEIAVTLQALAEAEDHDALVAIGCVIRGETYHFELVANESAAGITRVGLDHGIPVANAILTVDTEAQAWARVDEKGRDAARVAVEMANLLDTLG